MTFIIRHRGDSTRPILCTYMCPEHGEFDAMVERDENGEAPDVITCDALDPLPGDEAESVMCCLDATWTPSPISCRVRRVEVVRGNYEKPERHTYLDTRKLGEGQDPAEFQAERKKIWTEERRKRVKELLR